MAITVRIAKFRHQDSSGNASITLRRHIASAVYYKYAHLLAATKHHEMGEVVEDLWTPYKILQKTIQQTIAYPKCATTSELELCLKKYKHTFATLLRYPPKNEQNRMRLLTGANEGLALPNASAHLYMLSKDLVDEAIILSDMFDVDEALTLELLCTAHRLKASYPDLARGLVAVLLYYDGRRALVTALSDLFQVTSGVTWNTDLPKDVIYQVSSFTQSLVYDFNILDRIVDILKELDISKDTALLTKNRALGRRKHQLQFLETFEDIRRSLATCLFNWAAQRGLPRSALLKLIKLLVKYRTAEPSGVPDDVAIILLMAILYSFDATIVQRNDNDNLFSHYSHISNEVDVVQEIYDVLTSHRKSEETNCLYNAVKFGFTLSLACLRHTPHAQQVNIAKFIECDEQLVNEVIQAKVFDQLYYYILEKDIIYRNAFFYRRLHLLFTDFIDLMHSKVTELRGRADETARILLKLTPENSHLSDMLDNSFEMLMMCVSKFYKNNRANLSLCYDFWEAMDTTFNVTKKASRGVSLFKFLRLAGDLLPPILFVPYLRMIAGLTSCKKSARNAFNLFKQTGITGTASLSWDHFFDSLTRYYTNLRKENYTIGDTVYKQRALNRSICPQEIDGLQAVLEVIESVCRYDDGASITMCEHPTWTPQQNLLGLLTCSVPLQLKAQIIRTLSAMSLSDDTALQLWNNLETSQIITTVPNMNAYSMCNLEIEIEQNESRLETYEVTKAILDLLYSLMTTIIPSNLGSGPRIPGVDPYYSFFTKVIFLKFNARNYKDPCDKWIVGEKCLAILDDLLSKYDPSPLDFVECRVQNAPPGYHIMMQLNVKSDMLQLILLIIEEARQMLDQYLRFPSKRSLEKCALYSLKILNTALAMQAQFFDAHALSNSSTILAGLSHILLDNNPRTKKPDYILNTTHFVTYSSWLPRQSLYAVKILHHVSIMPKLTTQLLRIFNEDAEFDDTIRQGFVECMSTDVIVSNRFVDPENNTMNQKLELQIKEAIIELLKSCIGHPAPNLSYFLLGFDITRDSLLHSRLSVEYFDTHPNCLKSTVSLLDKHLESASYATWDDDIMDVVTEQAYSFLFLLCCNGQTSDMVLRYLRSCNDFLYRHLSQLPIKDLTKTSAMKQMAYLLKCTAIELKSTAKKSQVLRFQNFYELLMIKESERQSQKKTVPMELSHFHARAIILADETNIKTQPTETPKREKVTTMLLTHLFNRIQLEEYETEIPKWAYFDHNLTTKVFEDCEIAESEDCPKQIDIQKLHEVLNGEVETVQTTIAVGQRTLIIHEIETVLAYAVAVNETSAKVFATKQMMDAWKQVCEILFICASDSALNIDTKRDLLLEFIQKILRKIVSIEAQIELSILASEIILILIVNLHYCIKKKNDGNDDDVQLDKSKAAAEIDDAMEKANGLALKVVVKNLSDWILMNGGKSQKLRINLYAALLYCLHLIKVNTGRQIKNFNSNSSYISRLDRMVQFCEETSVSPNKMSLDVTTERDGVCGNGREMVISLDDKLIETICQDTISSHDVCKMSALSCIDFLLDVDYFLNFLNSIASRGYLSNLIDSLLQSDGELCAVLRNAPHQLRALYVYESKMAMMLRLSSSQLGAEVLLSERLLSVLASMKVFDMLPDIQSNLMLRKEERNDFIVSANERFHQIIFPVLLLCNSILATLGLKNHSAVSQIINFIVSHSDVIELVLRTGTPFMDLASLKLLGAVTGLVARAVNQNVVVIRDSANFDVSSNLFRIKRFMLTLLTRFQVESNVLTKMTADEMILYEATESNKTLHVKYFLEIVVNLTLYCRNTVANYQDDHRANIILFLPKIARSTDSVDSCNMKVVQNLGIIIDQLKGSIEHFNIEKSKREILLQQCSIFPNMNIESAAIIRQKELRRRLEINQRELVLTTVIVEQCLYVLWVHLDFYMHNHQGNGHWAIRLDCFESMSQKMLPNNVQLSSEDLSKLKKHLITMFTETFCKLMLSTTENLPDMDKRFNETLLRRILALIQMP